ncbi:Nin1 binding protein [Glugoides intestinalis]
MIIVLDANNIIERDIPEDGDIEMYTTKSVIDEIKDEETRQYLDSRLFQLTIREPLEEYVIQVSESIKNKLLYLSKTDIEVVALTLELTYEMEEEWIDHMNMNKDKTVRCNSKDNGVRNALNGLNILNDHSYTMKKFKLRCYACFQVYDSHVDFCKACGYNTITRITVIESADGEKLMFKKNYKPRTKVLKTHAGVEIRTEDQKEYSQFVRQRERITRQSNQFNID